MENAKATKLVESVTASKYYYYFIDPSILILKKHSNLLVLRLERVQKSQFSTSTHFRQVRFAEIRSVQWDVDCS